MFSKKKKKIGSEPSSRARPDISDGGSLERSVVLTRVLHHGGAGQTPLCHLPAMTNIPIIFFVLPPRGSNTQLANQLCGPVYFGHKTRLKPSANWKTNVQRRVNTSQQETRD